MSLLSDAIDLLWVLTAGWVLYRQHNELKSLRAAVEGTMQRERRAMLEIETGVLADLRHDLRCLISTGNWPTTYPPR